MTCGRAVAISLPIFIFTRSFDKAYTLLELWEKQDEF